LPGPSALNRPLERQYIAPHKKGKAFFALHLKIKAGSKNTDFALICFNFFATRPA
jgi:hypothetical protein